MISTQPFQVKMSVKPGCLNSNIDKKKLLKTKTSVQDPSQDHLGFLAVRAFR